MNMERKLLFGQRTVAALPIPTDEKVATYYDTQLTGLCIRVYPSGRKVFYVYRKVRGRPELLEIKRGSGLITLAANLDFIENAAIDDYGHAEFFWHLLHGLHPQPQNVWLIHQDDLPPLWKLLWERAWSLLLTLALGIPLGILALSPRFGPLQAAPTPERRRILEHIHASGRFMWKRHQQGDTQYPAFTDAVEQLSPKPKDTPRMTIP